MKVYVLLQYLEYEEGGDYKEYNKGENSIDN